MGHNLVIEVYQASKKFPKQETYSLTNQMRRAATSVTSNLAEGFSRNTKKEKQQFYYMAKGSLTEVQNQLLIARDVGYINQSVFKSCAKLSVKVHKLINGLIKTATSK